jgi:dUTP pyrophosphatase
MLKVKFKKLYPDAKLPVKGSLHAACYDVYARTITLVHNNKIKYTLGFATEIPEGYKGIIVPRSNVTKYKWAMLNSPGQIDSDYRGEWAVMFTSVIDDGLTNEIPYMEGDRIAQIYFEKVLDVEFEEVSTLEDSQRGDGGFGSTGLK